MLSYEFQAENIIKEGRTTQEALNEVKTWLPTANLPDLPDELLVLFLISCKNNIFATQVTIKAYYRIKNEVPVVFNNWDITQEELLKAANATICVSIPERMPNNTVVHFFKLQDTNYRKFDVVPCIKLAFMLLDISQRQNPPNDLVVVIDMKGSGLMHLTRLKLWAVKTFLEFVQEAMPLRIQMVHILNTTYVFDKVMTLARAFIKSELMSLIRTHPVNMDMNVFFKEHVPAACLPAEYGGSLPDSRDLNDQMIKQYHKLKPFFEAEEQLRASMCKSCN